MKEEYSVDVCRTLEKKFLYQKLFRPMRILRYDAGTELEYEVSGVDTAVRAQLRLRVEQFVGGGFAGQVYRVKVLSSESDEGEKNIGGVKVGRTYAMKILIPPSGFARFFRNLLYWIGFQGPFQPQVNPTAARAGALWQKLIRRGARVRFGDESVVNDIHATFVDYRLGSCGELSDWVDGRTWKLEVDDRLDYLKRSLRGKPVNLDKVGSPEFRAKKKFMADFVRLLHDMGAYEFARQYEWSTAKSQPNCLKRRDSQEDPETGLVAVDFRAGLALMFFLPMSPGDIKLIFKGIARGSLVQFDRGNLKQLDRFISQHEEAFDDVKHLVKELKACEAVYRDSMPDITHHHIRLLYSGKLWRTILESKVSGWRIRNRVDRQGEDRLKKRKISTFGLTLIGLVPLLGKFLLKVSHHRRWRQHYKRLWSSWFYLKQVFRARRYEKVIAWHRAGRINQKKALPTADSAWRFTLHMVLSILPAGLHRFFTDWSYARARLYYLFVRPVKLYFSPEVREQWLREMVSEGQKKHILSDDDADAIRGQIKEAFIQKYLKSLAVHVCTLPVTQIVSVIVSWIYVRMHPELSTPEAMAAVAAILVLFQITPISPGSLVRGFYVLYLVVRERNFKDYNIAVFLGFFKYIGYLAFPIQMAYRYPALARFMAGHWATEAVHIIPVFGERGALLEHWVFNLFYNWPLTVRRRMRRISEVRKRLNPRYWHTSLVAAAGALIFGGMDYFYVHHTFALPNLGETWWLVIVLTPVCGAAVARGCGGALLSRRIIAAAVNGFLLALFHTAASAFILLFHDITFKPGDIVVIGFWRLFLFGILTTSGAVLSELRLSDPDL